MKGKIFRTKLSRENIKITFGEVEYFVNEKKRVVVCRLPYIVNSPEGNRTSGVLWEPIVEYSKRFRKGSWWDGYTTGVAKCREGDQFDVSLGKRVAKAKAESLAYRQVANAVAKNVREIQMLLDAGNDFIERAKANIRHNDKYIADIA